LYTGIRNNEYSSCEIVKIALGVITLDLNTLRTGAFKLFKCTFPGSKQYVPGV